MAAGRASAGCGARVAWPIRAPSSQPAKDKISAMATGNITDCRGDLMGLAGFPAARDDLLPIGLPGLACGPLLDRTV